MNEKRGKLIITNYCGNVLGMLCDPWNNPVEIYCDSGRKKSLLGNIYAGRVVNTVNSINAAFVEYLPGCMGYLDTEEGISPLYAQPEKKQGRLKPGDRILVQVIKDAQKAKRPVLSPDICFTGKYAVLLCGKNGIYFSARFSDSEKKENLRACLEDYGAQGFGIICRTNSEHAQEKDVIAEIGYFSNLWKNIRASAQKNSAETLLYCAPEPFLSGIRDGYDKDIGEIITDDAGLYEIIKNMLKERQKNDLGKLVFYDNEDVPLSVLYNIEKNIEEALCRTVRLRSGGYVVIEPTEALVSIDVNTGNYISGRDAQKEYLKINLEAAKEIARQIRLRNLSGIIIIDFINMKPSENRDLLMKTLSKYLSEDPQKTTLVGMSKLNLVEITRKKGRRPLYELLDI